MTEQHFNLFLLTMTLIGAIVFVALYFVKAGYGMLFDKKWGPSLPNRVAWIVMEAPIFFVMAWLWYHSDRRFELTPFIIFCLFELHYFQRSFVFPFLIKGKSRMPIGIMSMGILFNVLNGIMQGEWLFYLAPTSKYTDAWLYSPQFIIGTLLFLGGMMINWQSDYIIRHLRKPGDTKHYLPQGGLFNYVTSANYLGELIEWCGFALLTWSLSGAVFAWWTFANLVPRANSIYQAYKQQFGNEVGQRKRIIPFIY